MRIHFNIIRGVMKISTIAVFYFFVHFFVMANCNEISNICPKTCSFLEWGTWSECSASCAAAGGVRNRTRPLCCPKGVNFDDCVFGCEVNRTNAINTQRCNEKCFNGGTYDGQSCECSLRFLGDCCEIDQSKCSNGTHYCDPNAICATIGDSFTCSCKNGFKGNGLSCADIDECAARTHLCDQNAFCFNTDGAYKCVCHDGFSGNGKNCTYPSKCSNGTHTCDPNAICATIGDSFACSCKNGFKGNGLTCVDIDECAVGTDLCNQNAFCFNTDGAYKCVCNDGFSGNGKNCTDIDECDIGTNNCNSDASCINSVGSYTCICRPGFSGDGIDCADINECASGTSNCHKDAVCNNTAASFTCTCKTGYFGNGMHCTAEGTSTFDTTQVIIAVIASVAAIVITVVIVIAVVILKRRTKIHKQEDGRDTRNSASRENPRYEETNNEVDETIGYTAISCSHVQSGVGNEYDVIANQSSSDYLTPVNTDTSQVKSRIDHEYDVRATSDYITPINTDL